jgi:hypothetical protein
MRHAPPWTSNPIYGPTVEQVLDRLYATPKDVVETVKNIYAKSTK